ncbi:MAG TPA: hypothetical protein VHS78_09355 [Candidatus Elarobacter sp.]|jgi:hypothetical protein|nr:hypothetical protein [Candidatus Elarobacter sp.]
MAIGYGNNAPQAIAFFTVGQTTPTRTMTIAGCCFWQLQYDAQGDLLVADDTQVSIYPPGSSTASRTLPQGGFSMVVGSQGDVAVGGYNMGSTVAVFPNGSTTGSYRVPGQPAFQSLAFSPTGELVVPQSDGTVKTFPHGSTTANRTFAVNGIAPSGVNTTRVAYDHHGNLALSLFPFTSISVYAPGSTTAAYSITGFTEARAFLFDLTDRLVVSEGALGTKLYGPGSATLVKTYTGVDAGQLAIDVAGDLPFSAITGPSGVIMANGTVISVGNIPNPFTVATYPSGSP